MIIIAVYKANVLSGYKDQKESAVFFQDNIRNLP